MAEDLREVGSRWVVIENGQQCSLISITTFSTNKPKTEIQNDEQNILTYIEQFAFPMRIQFKTR
jgi:hypothetical protein